MTLKRKDEKKEADILFNSNKNWSSSGASGAFDFQSVAVHELGHALGLNHSSTGTIMQPSLSEGVTHRDLSQDDINGIAYLYPGTSSGGGTSSLGDLAGEFWLGTGSSCGGFGTDIVGGALFYVNTNSGSGKIPLYRCQGNSDASYGGYSLSGELWLGTGSSCGGLGTDIVGGALFYVNTSSGSGRIPLYRCQGN